VAVIALGGVVNGAFQDTQSGICDETPTATGC